MTAFFFEPSAWSPWLWTLDDWLHLLFSADFALWILACFWLTRVYMQALFGAGPGKRRAPFILLVCWLGLSHLSSAGFLWFVIHFKETDVRLVQYALISIPVAEMTQAIVYLIIGWLLLRRNKEIDTSTLTR